MNRPTALALAFCAVPALAFAATPSASNGAAPYKAPRTSLGQPDLQGVWTNATITPLSRPSRFGERCLVGFGSTSGPPMLPVMYNNNYQIVQTKDAVLIEVEMVHDVRTIRLNAC